MAIIVCMLLGLFMTFEPITDNDYFWHIVIGKWINTNHTIPTKELFSWASGKPWVAHEWLNELIMYKAGNIGCLVIMLVIFAILYILMAKMLKLEWKKIFDFKLCYFLLMTVFFKVTGPRPYIVSLVFLAYLVYVLFSYLDDKKWAQKMIYTLPVLQILWVNFHGGSSSLIYLFIIGVLLCDIFVKIFKFKPNRWNTFKLEKQQIKTLCLVLVLTILASCLNPFGPKMLLYPFSNMLDSSMTSYILEWNSPSFHNFLGLYIFVMIAFPLFNLILQKKDMKLHEIGFQLMFLFMALKSQRFIGMYGIYSCWNIGKYFFVTDDIYETLKKPFKKFEKPIYYFTCVILVLGTALVGYKQISSLNRTGVIDNDGFYSDEAVQKLIELKPERLYNDYSQGGYLLYKLDSYNHADDVKVFSYGLGDVFSKDLLPDTVNLQDLYEDPKAILDKYNFDYLITTVNHTLHYYLEASNDYELVFSDDMCYIFRKI
ncbi:MAG: hypothetical protein PUD34_01145 [bacterium]|nr:hypothetical protein [bacterium]